MEELEISSYIRAGEIAKEVKKYVKEIIKPGVKLLDIAQLIDAKILELGGEAAFPVNLGLNEIAAHFTPSSGDESIAEGILKVDLGVVINGFIADTAISFDLTENNEFGEMIKLNKKILKNTGEIVRHEMKIRDVGEIASNIIKNAGDSFSIITSLCGHTLGKNTIHAGLIIPNYKNENNNPLTDIAFAIEPFVTSGNGEIFEGKGGGIYTIKNKGRVRDRDARNILEFIINNYSTRPFCVRWIEKAGFKKIKFSLGLLIKQGILYEYPILIEKGRKPVSQFENTFLITKDRVICTTQ